MNIETQMIIALSPFLWLMAWALRGKLRSLQDASILNTTGPQPCPCGSHQKTKGHNPIKHWWTLDQWLEKLNKIRDRKGKRKTKLSRLHSSLVSIQAELPKTEEEEHEKSTRFTIMARAYDKELERVSKRNVSKWMLCRHCQHVSRRKMHLPTVIEHCDYSTPAQFEQRQKIVYGTFHDVGGAVE